MVEITIALAKADESMKLWPVCLPFLRAQPSEKYHCQSTN
jgi:hypothetical protein